MRPLKSIIRLILLILFAITSLLSGQTAGLEGKGIRLIDDNTLSLEKRAEKAGSDFKALGEGRYYLTGYRFRARGRNTASGTIVCSSGAGTSKVVREGDRLNLYHFSDMADGKDDACSERIALFLHKNEGNHSRITDAAVLKCGPSYNTGDIPVFLLGAPDENESFTYVRDLFLKGDEHSRKRILHLIAVHDHKDASPLLYRTAMGEYRNDLRKAAIFWLSAVNAGDSFKYLKKISENTKETEIRKSLVFAFYILDSEDGNKELIRIAKNGEPGSARKDAIFWLGQRASKESIRTLKDVLVNDRDEDIRNAAVFAVSQLNNEVSVPMLIDIAKTNKNPNVRKKAIFWLGQKDDKRVIELFEKILLK